ncbi:hypothetical protein ACFWIJ_46605 [Streptomyces sp. NPDC127079]|uniref:hypothetical protein n=1 Tax=Streptomyces sp. NPDC127079 TaxID=3347132 RepID=UPI00364B9E45
MRDNFRSRSRTLALGSAGALVTASLITGALAAPAAGAEARHGGQDRQHRGGGVAPPPGAHTGRAR